MSFGEIAMKGEVAIAQRKRIVVWSESTRKFSTFECAAEAHQHFVSAPGGGEVCFWESGSSESLGLFPGRDSGAGVQTTTLAG